MEKFDNMKQNKVTDEELDDITAGKGLFDIFTAEFRGKKKKPLTLEMILEAKDDEREFNVTTLEMRDNPANAAKKKEKIMKL
jgi:hypothetical protein